jgi:hypothetical protein
MMNNHTTTATLITIITIVATVLIAIATSNQYHPTPRHRFLPHGDIIKVGGTSETEKKTQAKQRAHEVMQANLQRVFHIAKEIGHPETMQAILLLESGGGVANPVGNLTSPVGKRSYGVMQVQVVAAKSILTRYPDTFNRYFPNRELRSVSDEEIIALLISNHEANIRIACQHFALYLSLSQGDWHKAVAAYNMGIGNAHKHENHEEYPYVKDVVNKIQEMVKPFNKKHSLTLTPNI